MDKTEVCKDNPRYTKDFQAEIPDPTPVAVPVGFSAPESLEDMMRRLINTQNLQSASMGDFESEEEANDFDVPDGENPVSTLQHIAMVDELADQAKFLKEGGDPNGGTKPSGQGGSPGSASQNPANASAGNQQNASPSGSVSNPNAVA